MGYEFEWDPAKAAENIWKHAASFEKACTVFGDPLSILMHDPDHSDFEERYLVLGWSTLERLLVVSFAERGERTRLISARMATRFERTQYEEGHA